MGVKSGKWGFRGGDWLFEGREKQMEPTHCIK